MPEPVNPMSDPENSDAEKGCELSFILNDIEEDPSVYAIYKSKRLIV